MAFNEDRPVWKTSREEIVELVGEEPYQRLVDYITAREADAPKDRSVFLPHPQVRRRQTT